MIICPQTPGEAQQAQHRIELEQGDQLVVVVDGVEITIRPSDLSATPDGSDGVARDRFHVHLIAGAERELCLSVDHWTPEALEETYNNDLLAGVWGVTELWVEASPTSAPHTLAEHHADPETSGAPDGPDGPDNVTRNDQSGEQGTDAHHPALTGGDQEPVCLTSHEALILLDAFRQATTAESVLYPIDISNESVDLDAMRYGIVIDLVHRGLLSWRSQVAGLTDEDRLRLGVRVNQPTTRAALLARLTARTDDDGATRYGDGDDDYCTPECYLHGGCVDCLIPDQPLEQLR